MRWLVVLAMTAAWLSPEVVLARSQYEDLRQQVRHSWYGSVAVGSEANVSSQVHPNLYYSSLSLSAGKRFWDSWSIGAGQGVSVTSLGSELVSNDSHQTAQLGPMNLHLGKFWKLSNGDSLFASVSSAFPVTKTGLLSDITWIQGVSLTFGHSFFGGRYTPSLSLGAHKYFVSSEFNPSSDQVMKDQNVVLALAQEVHLLGPIFANVTVAAAVNHYVDGSEDYTYMNRESLYASLKQYSLALFVENGGFTDRGQFDLMYVNEYRRMVGLSAGVQF